MPTVVIADDSPTLRKIFGMVLEREGFTVVQAEDGVQGVQAVFAHQPDCVILDVQMPRAVGLRRCARPQGRLADRGHPGADPDLARQRERPLLG